MIELLSVLLKKYIRTFIPLKKYKHVGVTPKQLLNELEKSSGLKYYHLGNLDPMAEGLMVFVPHTLRFLESKFKNLKKTYRVSVLYGFSTDTEDLLGLIREYPESRDSKITSSQIKEALNYFLSKEKQRPHKVSYKNLNTKNKLNKFLSGSPLPDLPEEKVKIYDVKYIKRYKVSKKFLYNYILKVINRLKGNFRQKEILNLYNSVKKDLPNHFTIYDFEITVSSGFYIRSLVRDMGRYLGIPLTVYKLQRVKIGFWRL